MSITDRDIKLLRKSASKSYRLLFSISFFLLIVCCLTTAAMNIYLCNRFALMEGLTISDVFAKWTEGISQSGQYSGKLLMAIQRLQTALTVIVLAFLGGIFFLTRHLASQRDARILRFIEENLSSSSTSRPNGRD